MDEAFETRRDADIDLVRLAGNLLVVVMHAFAAYQYCTRDTFEFRFWQFTCTALSAAVMPAFFLISGYLFFRHLTERLWLRKIRDRFRRLVVPMVLWNLVFVAFYLSLSFFVPRLSARVASFGLSTWQGILGKTVGLMTAPIDIPLWYLRALFVFMLFAPIPLACWTARCSRRLRAVLVALPYALVVVYYAVTCRHGAGFALQFTYPAYALAAFLIGGHLGLRGRNLVLFLSRRWLWPFAVLGAAGMGYWFVHHWWAYTPLRDLAFLAAMPTLFLCLPLLRRIFPGGPVTVYLQRASFFLYCGHFLFCSVVLHLAAPFLPQAFPGKFSLLVGVFTVLGVFGTFLVLVCWWRFVTPRVGLTSREWIPTRAPFFGIIRRPKGEIPKSTTGAKKNGQL